MWGLNTVDIPLALYMYWAVDGIIYCKPAICSWLNGNIYSVRCNFIFQIRTPVYLSSGTYSLKLFHHLISGVFVKCIVCADINF